MFAYLVKRGGWMDEDDDGLPHMPWFPWQMFVFSSVLKFLQQILLATGIPTPPNGFFALIFYCFMSVEALLFLPTSIFCTPPNPLKWLLHHLLPYPGALLALISFRRTGQALLKPIGSGTVPGGGNKWHKSHIERTFTPPPPRHGFSTNCSSLRGSCLLWWVWGELATTWPIGARRVLERGVGLGRPPLYDINICINVLKHI